MLISFLGDRPAEVELCCLSPAHTPRVSENYISTHAVAGLNAPTSPGLECQGASRVPRLNLGSGSVSHARVES